MVRRNAAARAKRIAQHGIAQVADVGRLVGVDVGVLNNNLAVQRRGLRLFDPLCKLRQEGTSVEKQVDVAAPGGLGPSYSRRQRELCDDLFGDLTGGTAQDLGELEWEGKCEVTHFDAGRILDRQCLELDSVSFLDKAPHVLLSTVDTPVQHGR